MSPVSLFFGLFFDFWSQEERVYLIKTTFGSQIWEEGGGPYLGGGGDFHTEGEGGDAF